MLGFFCTQKKTGLFETLFVIGFLCPIARLKALTLKFSKLSKFLKSKNSRLRNFDLKFFKILFSGNSCKPCCTSFTIGFYIVNAHKYITTHGISAHFIAFCHFWPDIFNSQISNQIFSLENVSISKILEVLKSRWSELYNNTKIIAIQS